MALHESPTRGRQPQPANQDGQPAQTIMINDETQTSSELQLDIPTPPVKQGPRASFTSETSQTSDIKLGVIQRIRDSLSESRHQGSNHSHHSGSRQRHSRSSHGHCPVFEDRIEATREHIKKQVEIIMPEQKPYIVIGWFNRTASDPNERILQFNRPEELFKYMRKGERNVRGYKKYISLRSLRGFGLYKVSSASHLTSMKLTRRSAIFLEAPIFHWYSTPLKRPSCLNYTSLIEPPTAIMMRMSLALGKVGYTRISTTAKIILWKDDTPCSLFMIGQPID